jgi:aspartate dehydrogenase
LETYREIFKLHKDRNEQKFVVCMKKRIVLIGCGSIGSEILRSIGEGDILNAVLVAVLDIRKEATIQALYTHKLHSVKIFTNFEDLVKSPSFATAEIIIEAASQGAVKDYGKRILELGKTFLVLSSGAFSDSVLLNEMIKLAKKNSSKLVIPSGAIGGFDAIRSVKRNLDSITITTVKNPKALSGAPFFENSELKAESIITRTVLFEGSASDAISRFPANVNVAVTLALAGLGLEKTIVRVIADPNVRVNQHNIVASGNFGEIEISVNNNPMATNPKTSILAALSAIETIRSLCEQTFRIGS